MWPRVLLIEEIPRAPGARDIEALFAAEGVPARRIEWDGLQVLSQQADAQAIVALPSRHHVHHPTLLEWVRRRDTAIPVLVVLPDDADAAEDLALAASADDLLFPPVRRPELVTRLRRMLQGRLQVESVKHLLCAEFAARQLIGEAPVFLKAVARARIIAAQDSPALITGETGTGKELFARVIHHLSRRRDNPFIPVDCAALPEHLFENEMFGHERGAYTDAGTRQEGLATLAAGGTLFLDEVNSLSLAHQAKLLRFLQDRSYRPLGAAVFQRADVRVIAASNRDLASSVQAHEFREDLYFRLNVLDLRLPPLRERASDVALLAHHFLSGLRCDKEFSPDALARLAAHSWPGNVRELYNAVCRAAAFSGGRRVTSADLDLPTAYETEKEDRSTFREARARVLESFERAYLQDLLAEVGGNITQAARRAGKERRAFGRLVRKHHLKG